LNLKAITIGQDINEKGLLVSPVLNHNTSENITLVVLELASLAWLELRGCCLDTRVHVQ
jgi:hypothetical protein